MSLPNAVADHTLAGGDSAIHLPHDDTTHSPSEPSTKTVDTSTPPDSFIASASTATAAPGPAAPEDPNGDDLLQEGDIDSAYDSESLLGDDTMTLASFITDYRYENGRRYENYRDGNARYVSQQKHMRTSRE